MEQLVERFGLLAIFAGCVAEGETAALLAGFLTHQGVFGAPAAWLAIFLGAFAGDAGAFAAGRGLASSKFVQRVRGRPGFAQVLALAESHPAAFVILNRYVYGMRLAGGIAAGIASIPVPAFIVLNAISSALWASLFGAAGWAFGLGFEHFLARELAAHERTLIALGLAAAGAIAGYLIWRARAARN